MFDWLRQSIRKAIVAGTQDAMADIKEIIEHVRAEPAPTNRIEDLAGKTNGKGKAVASK